MAMTRAIITGKGRMLRSCGRRERKGKGTANIYSIYLKWKNIVFGNKPRHKSGLWMTDYCFFFFRFLFMMSLFFFTHWLELDRFFSLSLELDRFFISRLDSDQFLFFRLGYARFCRNNSPTWTLSTCRNTVILRVICCKCLRPCCPSFHKDQAVLLNLS